MDRIAITGMGFVTPAGNDKETLWKNASQGVSCVDEIKRFDASRYHSRIAGQVNELGMQNRFPKRLVKKLDTFSHMAMLATGDALEDAGIDLEQEERERVGVFLGNALGGWQFAERELRDLYIEGRSGISPYMASAWFPAAAQGQISIYYGLKGYSKTLVSDRASSAIALWYGINTLIRGNADLVIAGGTEAPVSPYALLCSETSGRLSRENLNPNHAYRPFDLHRDGFVIAEGAAMVVLEKESRANIRGRRPYGYLTGFGTCCDGFHYNRFDQSPDGLQYAIEQCLTGDADWARSDVDYICLDAEGTVIGDILEAQALKMVFGSRLDQIALSAPKSMTGNMLGAQTALDLVFTLLSLEHKVVLPTINFESRDPYCDLNIRPKTQQVSSLNRALIIARGCGGVNAVLAVEK